MMLRNIALFSIAFLYLITACAENFSVDQGVKNGERTYAKNCSTCHGNRMKNPQWGFNLELFPVDQKLRFVDSVTYGKNAMPPWEDVLSSQEIEEIWLYFLSLR